MLRKSLKGWHVVFVHVKQVDAQKPKNFGICLRRVLKQVYHDISISQDGISAMDSFVIYTIDRIAAGVCQTLVPLSLVTIYFTRIELLEGEECVFYLDHKVPCKLQEFCNQAEVESIWISTRPHGLPRQITSIVLGVICHSSRNREPENVILRQHIQRNLVMLL